MSRLQPAGARELKRLSDVSAGGPRASCRSGRASARGGSAERASDNPFVEYDDREQRLSLERRWLQEDRAYLDIRMKELRRRTAEKMAGLTGALSLPELPRSKGQPQALAVPAPPRGTKTGRKQSAAVRSLMDLQRELKESIGHLDEKPSPKVNADVLLVLPKLSLGLRQGQ